jgi:hypothetical protein
MCGVGVDQWEILPLLLKGAMYIGLYIFRTHSGKQVYSPALRDVSWQYSSTNAAHDLTLFLISLNLTMDQIQARNGALLHLVKQKNISRNVAANGAL